MLGSLGQFMSGLQQQQCLIKINAEQSSRGNTSKKPTKRDKTTFSFYQVQDKTHALANFAKNHQQINKFNKNNYQQKQPSHSQSRIYYQHGPFFVKPQITQDYIAKQNLKRKHNLLRAVVRSNQVELKSSQVTDFQDSFRRLSDGFSRIHPQPVLRSTVFKQKTYENESLKVLRHRPIVQKKSIKNCQKLIQYSHCLHWAKKHKKNYSHYQRMLSKNLDNSRTRSPSHRQQYMKSISRILNYHN